MSGPSLRNKKIDFSSLGQKKTLSNSSCHKCKNMIPVNEENICKGPLEGNKDAKKKSKEERKKTEACSRRFCNECLHKYYRESWILKEKSNSRNNKLQIVNYGYVQYVWAIATALNAPERRPKNRKSRMTFWHSLINQIKSKIKETKKLQLNKIRIRNSRLLKLKKEQRKR